VASRQTDVGVLLDTRGPVMAAGREGRPTGAFAVLELAQRAEVGGLDSIWVGDSLVSKPRLEPVAMLAAIATCTSRVRIGTAVLLPALRHPVTLAHTLATLDVLSGGRLVLGMGVGGAFTPEQKHDWSAAGVESHSRAGRFTEMVRIMKRLWTEDRVNFQGKHFTVKDVTLEPKPMQLGGLPVLLACHHRTGSEVQYRRAALYADGVMGITDAPEEYAQVVGRVDQLATDAGRDPGGLEHAMYMTVNVGSDDREAAQEADDFLLAYYGVRHWGDSWGPWASPDAVARRMAEYAQAGADHLVVRFASWDQATQLERFIGDVMPAFRQLANR
jgi:alkanesulfonate monooxygenase SsuD/methylene tetrahydromethanopterin reductase-like flavin-dependent oxidoreductase (luciferase family)